MVSISNNHLSPRTLFAAIEKTANLCPEHIAVKGDGGHGISYTYSELVQLVRQLANGLLGPAYAACDEIGILSENRPEWPLSYLAITAAGKTVIPVDASLKPGEIAYVINHSRLKAIFTSAKFEKALSEAYPHLNIFSFEESSPLFWKRILSDTHLNPPPVNETAVLIYTSGTTGEPKAVRLTHENLLTNIEGITTVLPFKKGDTFLSVLPLHHTFEATCGFLVPMISGATIVYARSLKSKEIKEDIEANKITVMCGVPLLYEKLYHSIQREIQAAPIVRRMIFRLLFALSGLGWILGRKWGKSLFANLRAKAGMTSMRMFVSGGAALPSHINRFFNLLGLDLQQGYGMTECSPVISVSRPDDNKFGSVGQPLPNVEIRIDNPDLAGVGEILVKSPSVTPGYKNNPEKTAELIKDGWLYTGDLGRLKDGHVWITGRKKNLIVSSAGKNIYPEQIEEALLDSKYIVESVVFGRKKKAKQGEEICAVIVASLEQFKVDYGISAEDPDMSLIERVINEEVARINAQMAEFKRITSISVQLAELEKTSTKKVKRFVYN